MIEKPPRVDLEKMDLQLFMSVINSGELKTIQADYLYWDKIKYRAKSKGQDAQSLWTIVKNARISNSTPLGFGKHMFLFTTTDYIQKALHQFDLNIGGTLGSNSGIAESDKTKYMISSIMEEAISSSQMEGANTTRKRAKEMIQRELKPRTKSDQMILNNYVTMQHIVQHKNEKLTRETLLHLHQLMTHNTLDDKNDEGVFRSNDEVYVVDHIKSEVVHTPPAHSELDELIEDLCRFFNEDQEDFIHPIVKGIIIHFMIGWIHPFTDGNGRTARALFYWYMLKNGYWLTEYLSISRIIKGSKTQYEKAYLYTESDDNDMTYFIHYHLKTMEKAFAALKEYINKKQREVVQAARFLKIPGINDRTAQLLKILHEDPDRVFNSKEIENRFGISNFTARADLKQMVELGFMDIIQVNKIKQNFIKSAHFDKNIKKYNI